jgi:hypothetical protein
MASLYKNHINGHDYWCIREMARVNGKPTAINTIYLGTVANIAKMATGANTAEINRIESKSYGSLWVASQIAKSFGLVDIVDSFLKPDTKRGPTVGEYFLYAVLNRMVDSVSKEALPKWFANTAIQFIRPVKDLELLDSRGFWRAWEQVDEKTLHSSLCRVKGKQSPQRLIEDPNALQASILAAFGHKVVEGKLLTLDGKTPSWTSGTPKKRGRPKGSTNKPKEDLAPKKRLGRPPKYLLKKAL